MLKNTADTIKCKNGSVTVETAIAFPFFISVLVLFVNVINFISGYETINHAIDLTCREMSDYAYLYHERVISELSDTIKTKADSKLNEVFKFIIEKTPDIQEDNELIGKVKNLIKDYMNDRIDKVDSNIYIPVAEFLFEKNLSKLCGKDPDDYTRKIGVVNGMEGFNFSESTFFDGNNEIKLCAAYELDLAIPFISNKHITIHHEYVMNAWLSGVGHVKPDNTDNIWKLDNFERGRRIRKIYGGNLPDNFPVISSFKEGTATIIKSLDFTCDTYLAEGEILKRLLQIIEEAEFYRGQSKPWGKDKIVIREHEIRKKEIIIVIPSDEMKKGQKEQFDEAQKTAAGKNIIFRIEKYGYKGS